MKTQCMDLTLFKHHIHARVSFYKIYNMHIHMLNCKRNTLYILVHNMVNIYMFASTLILIKNYVRYIAARTIMTYLSAFSPIPLSLLAEISG